MTTNPTIFKSYDIRGVYPDEINEEAVYDIARAFVKHTGATNVVIARDARLSSEILSKFLARGLAHQGAKVCDIGQVPTECLYFTIGNYDFDAGIMITASHNPKEYNGLKMMKRSGNDIQMVRGKDLFLSMESDGLKEDGEVVAEQMDIWPDYIKYILSFADLDKISPLRIVVDASNGVAGNVLSRIKDKLPIEMIALHFEPDGNFPNHGPNPLAEGAVDKISEVIKSKRADFGLMFDGDADRIFLVDESGKLVKADIVLLLLAKYFLERSPNAAIAYNAICSKSVPEVISKWGGKPIRTQVGFVNVREGLMENNGEMGGELSGHYCFKDNYYMDSGMISLLILLQVLSEDSRKVSQIAKELSPYAKSPELNFAVADKDAVLEKIKQKYSDGKQDFLDGVTVEYDGWWFNVRASNTEPLLRLTIEANTQKLLDQKKEELISAINS